MNTGPGALGLPGRESQFEKEMSDLRRRLVREAGAVVDLLEASLETLWTLDAERARQVRRADDTIDAEEVAIEEECFRLMALHRPVASDFRALAFAIKVNAELERVADHAAAIAKVVTKIERPPSAEAGQKPAWPTSLVELGRRVPLMCHSLLRVMLTEDVEGARAIVAEDEVIDQLDRRLFDETVALMQRGLFDAGMNEDSLRTGLLVNRVGRLLERTGDLMTNIAEDIVYLRTGAIVRHAKRRDRRRGGGASDQPLTSSTPG